MSLSADRSYGVRFTGPGTMSMAAPLASPMPTIVHSKGKEGPGASDEVGHNGLRQWQTEPDEPRHANPSDQR
jgi:hypothetical protein